MGKFKVGKQTEITVDGSPRDRELRAARAKRNASKPDPKPVQGDGDSKE